MKWKILYISIICFYNICLGQNNLFSEVSSMIGINYIYPGNDNQEVGAGVTILDVNNDGWDDIFQSGGVFESKLWINKNGKFIDATEQYFNTVLDSLFIQSAVSGDYDNDGYSDLFICNYGLGIKMGNNMPSILLKNIKGKKFEPVFISTFKDIGNHSSATWGDINNDGFIDLYITNYVYKMNNISNEYGMEIGYDPICLPNLFFINVKGKKFINKTKEYGIDDDGCGLMASFTDIDNDCDVDLMLLNDFGDWNHKGNKLFMNNLDQNKLIDISKSNNFYNEMYGMGIGPGDYDNDGDLDYYITNIGENYLYKNNQSFFSIDTINKIVIDEWVKDSIRGTAWSGIFLDYENDSDLDLYVSKGNVKSLTPRTVEADPNKFYINDKGKFIDTSSYSGVNDILSHRGAGLIDIDHDGDLDIVSSVVKMHWAVFGGMDQKIKVFKNQQKENNNWIGFKLVGVSDINKDALGSRVEVEINGQKLIREVDGGSGHSSQSSKNIYIGLGKDIPKISIKIIWLGGKITEIKNLKTNRVYKINSKGKVQVLY